MKYNSNLEPAEISHFWLNLLSYLRDFKANKVNAVSFIAGCGDYGERNIKAVFEESICSVFKGMFIAFFYFYLLLCSNKQV